MADLYIERQEKFLKALDNRFYGHVHVVILLGTYELLLRFFFNPRIIVYDGVDIWFKLAHSLTQYGTLAISLIIILNSLYFLYCDWFAVFTTKETQGYRKKKKDQGGGFDPSKNQKKPFRKIHKFWGYNILFVILIGFAFGSLMYILLPYIAYFFAGLDGDPIRIPLSIDAIKPLREYHTSFFLNLALAFGAGFYDELLFRVLLDRGLRRMAKFDQWKKYLTFKQKWVNETIIIVMGAAIFSLSHYLIPYGDTISMYTFLHRLFFGIAIYYIFLFTKKNFAIIAWAHVFYDLWYYLLV